MAHPFNDVRQSKVEHARAKELLGDYEPDTPTGLGESSVAKAIRRGTANDTMRADGGAVQARADRPNRARGGKVGGKKKSGNTVNVIIGHNKPPMVPGVAAPPMAPPMPPRPMMPPPPPGAGGPPPMAGGPMPPPGAIPGMRAAGGRVKGKGDGVTSANAGIGKGRTMISHDPGKNDLKDVGRPPVITKATGGAIDSNGKAGAQMGPKLDGGGGGGRARLQKIKKYG